MHDESWHGAAIEELARRTRAELDAALARLDRKADPAGAPVSTLASTRPRTWTEQARASLRRAGRNRGAARDLLIDLFARETCALSAQDIEAALTQRRVARASIYRALELLRDLRLIAKVDLGDGIMRFERAHLDADRHHHHLVCDRCGALRAFDDEELEGAIDRLSGRLGFDATGHEVTVHGLCPDCR